MYSGNPPPSFTPGTLNGFDQEQIQSSAAVGAQIFGVQNNQLWENLPIQATGDIYSQPPSQGDMSHGLGNSQNKFQGPTAYRGLGQTPMTVDDTKAPSFTDLGYGQGDSYNKVPYISRGSGGNNYVSGTGGQPLSVGDMARGGVSETSGGVDRYEDDKAPGLSDVNRRGTSETGASATTVLDGPDANEFVGISLVGKNFRKFYPNAFNKDDEN